MDTIRISLSKIYKNLTYCEMDSIGRKRGRGDRIDDYHNNREHKIDLSLNFGPTESQPYLVRRCFLIYLRQCEDVNTPCAKVY